MLEKFIFHIKNIIFFQIVVCFFCISLIIWLLQALNKEHKELTITKQNAQEALTEETLKLYSITNSTDQIQEAYKKYSDFIDISSVEECDNYLKLTQNIQNLSIKYGLIEPIDVKIHKVFLKNEFQESQADKSKIIIENYDVSLKFSAQNFQIFLEIIRDIYSYMPPNTTVTYLMVKNQKTLEPSMVYKLSSNRLPDFIYVKLNMRSRKLTAKK